MEELCKQHIVLYEKYANRLQKKWLYTAKFNMWALLVLLLSFCCYLRATAQKCDSGGLVRLTGGIVRMDSEAYYIPDWRSTSVCEWSVRHSMSKSKGS